VHVRHHVVPEAPLVFRDALEVDVVEVGAHLRERRIRDVSARAELALRLERFDGPSAPRAHLDVPRLALAGAVDLAVDEGGGAARGGQRVEPVLALILGIIPGFGIGHLLAGSPQWTIWLIADIIIFVVWPGGFFVTDSRAYGFLGLLVLVERIFEGISAYQAAGGSPIFRDLRSWFERAPSPAELALPVGLARGVALR
jgi:hypothetical protein